MRPGKRCEPITQMVSMIKLTVRPPSETVIYASDGGYDPIVIFGWGDPGGYSIPGHHFPESGVLLRRF